MVAVAAQSAFSQLQHTMGARGETGQPLVDRVPGVGEAGMLVVGLRRRAGGIPAVGGTIVNNRVLLVAVQALLLEVVVAPDP